MNYKTIKRRKEQQVSTAVAVHADVRGVLVSYKHMGQATERGSCASSPFKSWTHAGRARTELSLYPCATYNDHVAPRRSSSPSYFVIWRQAHH